MRFHDEELHLAIRAFFAALTLTMLATPLAAEDLSSQAAAARDEGLRSTIAWDVLESLTTEVGPRPVGTPAMDRARDWAMAKLEALGFTNLRLETFTTPAWTRAGMDTAEVLSPYPQHLHVLALGGSSSTAPGGLVAEIALFRSYQEFLDQPPGSLQGKIAVVTQVMAKTQDFSAYSDLRAQRTQGAAEAAKRGAIGYMMRSLSTDTTRLPHAGMGADAHIPSVALSGPDADLLERMAARAKPVRVRMDVRSAMNPSATAYNISGEIPGTSQELIIVGGHLDSWDQGTGALDDGAGIAIAMAAAKAATVGDERPRRTIRVVLWGSEEQGGSSEAYFAAHEHEVEKMVVVGESDDGADGIYDVALPGGADLHPAMKAFRLATAPLRVVSDRDAARYGGEDVAGLVNAGVPAVSFRQSVERYMDIHHSADDTLDKVDPQKMAQSVATWAAFLRTVASSDIDFRKLAADSNAARD